MHDTTQSDLVGAIEHAIRENPDRPASAAIEASGTVGRTLTFGELGTGAEAVAKGLRALDVQADEPVLVYVSNLPGDLQSLLGVWRAGAVAVPVHRDSVPDSIASVQSRAAARLAVIGSPAPQALPEGMARCPGHALLACKAGPPPEPRPILEGAALVMFTSGSTGEPKGVVLSGDRFLRKLRAIDEVLEWPSRLRSLLVLQLNFAFGQWVSWLTLLRGGTVLMRRKLEALDCLADLEAHGIDQVALVPTMMRAMLASLHDAAGERGFANLRASGRPALICTGGEPLAPELGRRFREMLPATQIADVFGLTETCTSDFILPPALFDNHPGSIGFATPGVRFRIVDPERGIPLTTGETGALEIASDFMMAGYLDAPDLTASQFHDGYLRTGDLARIGPSGEVRLAGRSKDLIVRGGNKISPIEVDAAMIRHPDVDASLTVGAGDALMGERIHTVIVPRNGAAPDPEQLRIWAGNLLDKYKIPDRIHLAERLPQGRTGKDDRGVLLSWLEGQGLLNETQAGRLAE